MSCKPTTLASKYAYMTLQNNDIAFQQGIVAFDVLFRQSNPADYYDRAELLSLTTSMNAIKGLPVLKEDDYGLVYDRLVQAPLTYIEVADFLQQSGYTIGDVNSTLRIFPFISKNSQVNQLLNQLNFYFSENIASSINGSTCGAVINPFLAVIGILSKLSTIDIGALFGPLASVKEVINNIVDKLRDTLLKQVENLVKKVSGIISQIKRMAIQVLSQFRKMVENVRAFLSDLSIAGIKAKIDSFITKAVSQFQELTPEVIALLLFRFCQFSEMVQAFMQSPITALQERIANFENTTLNLESQSLRITASIVANGGRRVRTSAADDARGRLVQLANSTTANMNGNPGGNINLENNGSPPATSGLRIPAYVADGTITEQQANAILSMNDSGIPGYCNFTDGVWNMHAKRGRLTDCGPGDGYRRVKDEVWVKLIKSLDMIPDLKPVSILSGYRSSQYNRKIGGAAKTSLHMSGMAIDVAFPGGGRYEAVARFIAACSTQGFLGIQTYPSDSFTHCDIGSKRSWSGHGADGTSGRWGGIIRQHLDGNVSSISNVIRTGAVAPTTLGNTTDRNTSQPTPSATTSGTV